MKEWISQCKRPPRKELRTDRERKKWIRENHPDIKFVRHPKNKTECIAIEQDTLMLVGHRTTAGRQKQMEFHKKAEAKEELERATESMAVKVNSKARPLNCSDLSPVSVCDSLT